MQKAINDLAAPVDAPIIFPDDDDDVHSAGAGAPVVKPMSKGMFAKPMRRARTFAMRVTQEIVQSASDPIARLRDDGVMASQARAIIHNAGAASEEHEGINLRSGFYRTLNDTKLYEVPWPNDYVYRNNGKKASYDTMTVSEFVIGYCLPVMEETEAV